MYLLFFCTDIYTIEFQKKKKKDYHIHTCFFSYIHPTSIQLLKILTKLLLKYQTHTSKKIYELVKTHMKYGPCDSTNKSASCMKDEKCLKYFPKIFNAQLLWIKVVIKYTKEEITAEKNGIILDNCYVVPYNPKLLKVPVSRSIRLTFV